MDKSEFIAAGKLARALEDLERLERAEARMAEGEKRREAFLARAREVEQKRQEPKLAERIIEMANRVRLKFAADIDEVVALTVGGTTAMGTRGPGSPDAPTKSRATAEGATITGIVTVTLQVDGSVKVNLTALDSADEPLERFRYTLEAVGHGSHPDFSNRLCETGEAEVTGLPAARYKVTIAREDDSDAVEVAFEVEPV